MQLRNAKGVALTIVIIVVIMLSLLAGYVTQLGYNQKKLSDSVSGKRAKIYYRAQAGVVEANWRIRENYTAGLTAGSFTDDSYDPASYQIDVDEDGRNDCDINIGPAVGANKQRSITSTGLDV